MNEGMSSMAPPWERRNPAFLEPSDLCHRSRPLVQIKGFGKGDWIPLCGRVLLKTPGPYLA